MLIDGGLADTKPASDFLEGDAVAEVQNDDVTTDGRFQLVYTLMQGLQFLIEAFRRREHRIKIQQVEAFRSFLDLSVTDLIKTTVSYTGQQIRLGCLFPKTDLVIKQTNEDVVYYILAHSIVVQEDCGQTIHLTVMLFEQRFEFPLICHTPIYTHEQAEN